MKTLVGFRPSGRLHIGHYLSVIKPALTPNCDVLIADYHAPSVTQQEIVHLVEILDKFGIYAPILQREVFNGDIFFRLLELAHFGELERMTQFQTKKRANAHLFIYPVLMAHDIIGYEKVIVGEDQKQHLNFARDLLQRYNKQYNENLIIPIGEFSGGRIKDLLKPESKMSKSTPSGCLFLDDTPEEIRKKIKKANTNPLGLKNLHTLYREFVDGKIPTSNEQMKAKLADAIVQIVA